MRLRAFRAGSHRCASSEAAASDVRGQVRPADATGTSTSRHSHGRCEDSMPDLRKLLRAEPGGTRLADIDPRSTPGLPGQKEIGGDAKGWSKSAVAAIS